MATLDFRPKTIDIICVAGDSISFNLTVVDIGNLTNPVFTGQVRDAGEINVEDFVVTPTVDGAVLRLTPAQTRSLSELPSSGGVVVGGTKVWKGRYDVQLAHDPDMVRTLIRGTLTIEMDVTRSG